MNAREFKSLVKGSIEYEIEDGILTITGYWDGREVRLDLTEIDDEILDRLIVEDEEEERG